ncbi:MAG TPA: hypothetical protein VHP63_05480, partial [candidate division Zixibacteria bacterium]|nr:hypothetical protein [candidate division Zixibacteria bacterium]
MVSATTAVTKKRGRKPVEKKATVITPPAPVLLPDGTVKREKKNPVTEREWRRYRKMQSIEMRQDLLNKYLPL